MDLFKDRQTQFGLDPIMMVPTSGDGSIAAVPRSVAGVDYWSADLTDCKNILIDLHSVNLDDVRAFSGWFMGGESQGRARSTDMIIKAIDPNKAGNLGLVNRRKIRLRRLSIAVHFIIKNHIKRSSYNSFQPDKEKFEYTEEVSGRKIVCGLILLKLLLLVMKPQLVIDHREKEVELEALTLAGCSNNVRDLLTSMQDKRDEINTLRKDGVTYDQQRFLTLIFDKLGATKCVDFAQEVKREKNAWIKDSSSVDEAKLVADFTNLYTNYKRTGDWEKVDQKEATIIALATQVDHLKKQVKASKPSAKGTNPKQNSAVQSWRFEKKGTTITGPDGKRYTWCPRHGHKDKSTGKQPGMYMPEGHDHDEWAKEKAAKDEAYKQRIKEKRAAGKRKSEDKTDDKPKKKGGKQKGDRLALAKSFVSSLTTQMQVGDDEAKALVDNAMEKFYATRAQQNSSESSDDSEDSESETEEPLKG